MRKKNIIFIHLETQYAKTDYKNEIYAKNWARNTWIAKVNSVKKSTINSIEVKVKVNAWKSQLPEVKVKLEMMLAMMRSDDVNNDVNRCGLGVTVREGVGRRVKHVAELFETVSGMWGRVEHRMETIPALFSRLFDDLHVYMICVLVRGQENDSSDKGSGFGGED